jgi:nucleotide-binding universal stress UspA family protein
MTTSKPILCAIDLSPGSDRVLAQAAELALLTASELELLYVYRPPILPLEEGDPDDNEDEVARVLSRVERELTRLSEPLRAQGARVKVSTLEGTASDTILRASQRAGAGMIVVGTHGRGGFKQFILGGTAERVVRMSTVPVVTVPLRA